ncbi:MAG: 2-dehydro-3-deoxy-6-phosphogalactonate aldolase [Alphaproteobacteria bacterium]|nr:2-dehydro-3-deoxy-6-phosphogalactonate aldolase [Alphaproteobacteria bacterium]MBU2337412.1 2-dehydro-3-deoxy-6-phosphogalactonate aldolase [Alphaproteobacteria bacterium]MBU2366715.1 2-dehydro-3-deoxy-6-phosphogalactonate aldolase [Alphaproteobacteria bacterium]
MNNRNIIAILRGIVPSEAVDVCRILAQAGIALIEIPLNSPQALQSISLIAQELGGRVSIGAGTVLTTLEVDAVQQAGGTFIVSPNTDAGVISETIRRGMRSFPGVFTPTEAFQAINVGATGLKFFPAEVLGVGGIRAIKAVLPPSMPIYAVGGAAPDNFGQFIEAGCTGFGLGTYLYKPGKALSEIARSAALTVSAYDASTR